MSRLQGRIRPQIGGALALTRSRNHGILVLGTHRSGTSALTHAIHRLGATLPANIMPASVDNPGGYFESNDFVELNDAILDAVGTNWHDDAPIPHRWFSSDHAEPFYDRALEFLDVSFRAASVFVLKDPRTTRLVPFWRSALTRFGIASTYILIVRHPMEVARSLQERHDKGLPSIESSDKSNLLWLREVLESEHKTRGLKRAVITYDALVADWRTTLTSMLATSGLSSVLAPPDESSPLADVLSVKHRHHWSDSDGELGHLTPSAEIYELLAAHAEDPETLDTTRLDVVREALDDVEQAYSPLRRNSRIQMYEKTPWPGEVLDRIAERSAAAAAEAPKVVFVSARPDPRSYAYRVADHVAALRAAGGSASSVELTTEGMAQALEADLVLVFRETWNDALDHLYTQCRAQAIPVGFDIDDLLFDPEVITVENFDYLRQIEPQRRSAWLERHVGGYRRTLIESDFAVVATKPIADAAQALGIPAYVLSNGLGVDVVAQAEAALVGRSAPDGLLRVGFASGSPTHQKDFATISPVLCELLDELPNLRLTLVGHLDQSEFPELRRHRGRIETRPWVDHAELIVETARFDINVVPLELGNPFCEGKSELKYFEAALVEVPTVAAATAPYSDAINDGETGFVAATPDDWRRCLHALLDDAGERARIGQNARHHALAAFGPDAQSLAARATFQAISRDLKR